MKKVNVTKPYAMTSAFAYDVYSASGTTNFEIPAATSTSADDTCVQDDGFLPITSTDLDDGGIAPERKNFNGLFYLSTDQRNYLQNGGVITFDANVSTAIGGYPEGAVLDYISGTDFKKVISLIDDNTNNFVTTPSYIDGVNWQELDFGAPTDYANQDLSNLTATGKTKVVTLAYELDFTHAVTVSTTSSANWVPYTATADGMLFAETTGSSQSLYARIMYDDTASTVGSIVSSGNSVGTCFPMVNGQTVKYQVYGGTNRYVTFVPFKKS